MTSLNQPVVLLIVRAAKSGSKFVLTSPIPVDINVQWSVNLRGTNTVIVTIIRSVVIGTVLVVVLISHSGVRVAVSGRSVIAIASSVGLLRPAVLRLLGPHVRPTGRRRPVSTAKGGIKIALIRRITISVHIQRPVNIRNLRLSALRRPLIIIISVLLSVGSRVTTTRPGVGPSIGTVSVRNVAEHFSVQVDPDDARNGLVCVVIDVEAHLQGTTRLQLLIRIQDREFLVVRCRWCS